MFKISNHRVLIAGILASPQMEPNEIMDRSR